MSRLPRLTARTLIRALMRTDFTVVRIRGSHRFLRHVDGRTTVVPVHRGETIGPGLLRQILTECDLTGDDLQRLL